MTTSWHELSSLTLCAYSLEAKFREESQFSGLACYNEPHMTYVQVHVRKLLRIFRYLWSLKQRVCIYSLCYYYDYYFVLRYLLDYKWEIYLDKTYRILFSQYDLSSTSHFLLAIPIFLRIHLFWSNITRRRNLSLVTFQPPYFFILRDARLK